jgi:hypothetical protein
MFHDSDHSVLIHIGFDNYEELWYNVLVTAIFAVFTEKYIYKVL